ncbi:hypothetical protein [Aliigemmobacter aestuarii]|nr:hypothetical protein [Gemmobacter aestuarii]
MVWPLVALALFQRTSADRALIWTILGGYLVLPPLAAINLPVVPDLTKDSIPALAAAAIVFFYLKGRFSLLPQSWIGRGLMALFVLGPFATVLTNADPVPKVDGDLQGMRIYDSVASVANQFIALLPFFLARKYLATPEAMRHLLVALVLAGLVYSLPMLVEIRLSPQMNVWVYGYFQHDFFQTIRFGGYRPVVFLPHGLWVALFTLMTVTAAAVLLRDVPVGERPRYFAALLYLSAVLILCKSLGALIFAVALVPLAYLLRPRAQVLTAAVLAVMVVAYPILRGAHLVPLDDILRFAEGISAERAHSLAFRIGNEEALLDKAAERIWFGWGGYGRNLLYDPLTGAGRSIADGAWIITMGIYGWSGYIAQFGLLALPLFLMGREAIAGRDIRPLSPYAGAVALLLAFNMLDMLPNATLIPLTWLMAGALIGHAEALAEERRAHHWLQRKAVVRRRPSRTVI